MKVSEITHPEISDEKKDIYSTMLDGYYIRVQKTPFHKVRWFRFISENILKGGSCFSPLPQTFQDELERLHQEKSLHD